MATQSVERERAHTTELGPARALLALAARGDRRWTLVVLAAVVVTRLPALFLSFFSEDEAAYSALATRLVAGFAPYIGAVDHKPPGIALWYALVYAVAGHNQLLAVRLSLFIVVAATALVIGRLAVVRSGDPSARIAGMAYAIASAALGMPNDTQAANTELYAALPLCLAALAVTRGGLVRLVSAGALIAVATLFRYPSALIGGAFAVFVLVRGTREKVATLRVAVALGALAAGFLAVAALFWATLHRLGAVEAFLFWGWKYNFSYLNTLTDFEKARNALESSIKTALWWIPLWLIIGPPRRALELAWLGGVVVGLTPGGRYFGHYYLTLLPPVCLLVDARRLRGPIIAAWGAAVALGLLFSFGWYRVESPIAAAQPTTRAVAKVVAESTRSDERVFVWGASPEIYYYADRMMATRFAFLNYQTGRIWGSRYVHADATGTDSFIVPRGWQELLADLKAAPPALIIDGGAGRLNRWDLHPIARYPVLARWVDAHYRLDRLVAGVPIYARK
jgi:hypothetical protein